MRGLYAIVDVETLRAEGLDPVKFAESVLGARPAAVQLRAKELPARETLALLRAIAPMCHRAKVPLVANDRADLAAFAGCDMVHVGQDDISIDLVRRIAPGLGVGVSTHTPEQLKTALAAKPTYVAYGPVFATASKKDAYPTVGVDALNEAAAMARAAGVPLVAVGGITLERAREIAKVVDAVAVIAALARHAGPASLRDVEARAVAFQAVFDDEPKRVAGATA
jgi:thiamine-phosphate pyrophosphorylase